MYALYVYTNATTPVAKLATSSFTPTCDDTTCSYTPTLNLPAGSYKWAVRSGNTAGWSGYSTWLVFSTSAPSVPTAQTPSVNVTVLYTGNPTFTWTKTSDTTMYALYVYTNTLSPVAKLATSSFTSTCGTSTCSYTPTLNLPAGSYKWAVRAGNTVGWSGYSTWLVFSVL
jgi:3',5'-cyclic AMP phosphodiesterase CpdA